jgi:estrone sulfotransferase
MIFACILISFPRKAWQYGTGIIGLRPDDVWLVSFPKAGSTWVRFLLCNLISLSELDGQLVDFHFLDNTMPALGYSSLSKPWPYTTIPRFIKTHQPYCSLLFGRPGKTIYVIRDPKDVMVSYYHFQQAHKLRLFQGSFSDFIHHPRYGLEACLNHYLSWQPRINYLVRYEALKHNAVLELTNILQAVETNVPDQLIPLSVERSSFSKVRTAQERTGLSGPNRFHSQFKFARKGQTGEWINYFSNQDLTFYEDLCHQYKFDYDRLT